MKEAGCKVKRHNIVLYFLCTYLAIIAAVLVIGSLTYYQTLAAVRSTTMSHELINLKKTASNMDASLREFGQIVFQLNTEPSVIALRRETLPLKGKAYILIRELSNQLQQYNMSNLDISDFYIYFRNLDIAISPSFIMTDMKNLSYGRMFYYENMDYQDFRKIFFSRNMTALPISRVFLGKFYETQSVFTYAQNLSNGLVNPTDAVVFMLVESKRLAATMGAGDGNGLFILDESGHVLLAQNVPEEISLQNFSYKGQEDAQRLELPAFKGELIYYISPLRNWTYARLIPDSYFSTKAAYVRKIFTVSVISLLIGGSILSVYFAFWDSKPYVPLLGAIADKGKKIRFIQLNKLIEITLTDLLNNNKQLREEKQILESRLQELEEKEYPLITTHKTTLSSDGEEYYYPLDMESKILNFASAGMKGALENLIEEIYRQNYVIKQIGDEETIRLYNALGVTIRRLNDRIKGVGQGWNSILKENCEPRVFFNRLINLVDEVCNQVASRKKSHNDDLILRMLTFIRENYTNVNLCLQMVADHFGISDKYCSDFFQEQTGENFSNFVEDLRMQKILELLNQEENTVPIANISRMAGYYNVNTLYKAFKRKFGQSPSSYRLQKH
jgi:AraC-like DNA-binding protein